MFNWIIGIVIFAAAGWMFYKHIQKSKQGKCPSCSSDCSCEDGNCQCH
ncbi:MAG: FeoB-associated Cys-rich membrane protein [Bacillota bacterium]|nr:FeoB-associated Cys-rich membrane protein [Bacillota bacterium]